MNPAILHDRARSADLDDFLDQLIAARDAAMESRCPHGLDLDECSVDWIEDDARWERSQDA